MFPYQLGVLQIIRVEEFATVRVPVDMLLDQPHKQAISESRKLIPGGCYDFDTHEAILALHAWVVRTPQHLILIDSCAGNDKERPGLPGIHQLQTPWLRRLREHGIAPEEIDYVVCTHLHADHVGWNTRREDARWVPTFPNATYIFGRTEFDHWKNVAVEGEDVLQKLVFEDSVRPCVEAGCVRLVGDGFAVDDWVNVEAAPGHTVGHTIVRARSGAQVALFVGDVVHSPIQFTFPDVNHEACEIPEQSRTTRRRILAEAAENGHLLIPAHFPAPGFGRVSVIGDRFSFRSVG